MTVCLLDNASFSWIGKLAAQVTMTGVNIRDSGKEGLPKHGVKCEMGEGGTLPMIYLG